MKEKENYKKENNYKLKISLKISTLKYSPSDEIEGILIIQPNKDVKLSNILENSEFIILLQEKISCQYFENGSKTFIIDEKLLKLKNNKDIDNRKILQIPIKYKIPPVKTKNFHPSFIYFSESIKCYISHTISIELPFISNKSSVNIFIRKIPIEDIDIKTKEEQSDNIIFGDELIKKYYFFNAGKFSYYIKSKKSVGYKDKYPVEIHIDEREMGDIRLESIFIKIKKQIYFYNELNVFTDTIEESYDMKQLIINKNKKNKNSIIFENLKLPKTEFIPISSIDIHKINLSNSNFNFTPPVNNNLFKCDYNLEITFSFNDKSIQDKIIDIPIDFYDSEFNNKYDKNNEINKKSSKKKIENKIKVNNNCNEFINITKEDIMNIIDGDI